MSEIVDFIKENYLIIIVIVVLVLILLTIINIKGIDLNTPKPESKLVQEITVETLDMMSGKSMEDSQENVEKMKLNPAESLCESYLGNSEELEGACNQLTETNCAQTSCCGFTKTEESGKCVAGGLHGPTYKTDKDGNLITIDSYYYLGKCHGQCPT
jgi:hypothetical protein